MLRLLDAEGESRRKDLAAITPIAVALLVVGLVVGAVAVYAFNTSNPVTTTTTQHVTSTQYQTTVQYVTFTTTVPPTGSQSELSGATEVIPSGDSSITLGGINFPYNGYLEVTYIASNSVSISYKYGSTTIASPNSETGTNLIMPVNSGSLQISILNGACGILGCPSITLTLTMTYYY